MVARLGVKYTPVTITAIVTRLKLSAGEFGCISGTA
jgi:hypothetical protein